MKTPPDHQAAFARHLFTLFAQQKGAKSWRKLAKRAFEASEMFEAELGQWYKHRPIESHSKSQPHIHEAPPPTENQRAQAH